METALLQDCVFRRLPGPGRPSLCAHAGSQVASSRLAPAARDLDGGKVLIFHQVLSDTSPLLKLRTGHKQQWPLPVTPRGSQLSMSLLRQLTPSLALSTASLPGSSLDRSCHLMSAQSSPGHCLRGLVPLPHSRGALSRGGAGQGSRGSRGRAGCWSPASFPLGG